MQEQGTRRGWLSAGLAAGLGMLAVLIAGAAGPRAGTAAGGAGRAGLPPGVPTAPLPSVIPTGGLPSAIPTGAPPTWTPAPAPCSPAWHPIALPAVPPDSGLYGIAGRATGDIWAVGYQGGQREYSHALIEHWDGRAWRVAPAPAFADESSLRGVATFGAADAWAVGTVYSATTTSIHTLTEHWDGRAWQVVPSPNPDAQSNGLVAVAGTSGYDVWAVGNQGALPLILHWDGTAWTRAQAPILVRGAILYGVTAAAPDDAWAVGESFGAPWLLHWDGHTWQNTPAPPVAYAGRLYSVTGGGADAWAVGYFQGATGFLPLLLHWDGAAWSIVPGARGSDPGWSGLLYAVTQRGPNDVWAVGQDAGVDRPSYAWSEHWDGQTWRAATTGSTLGGLFLSGVTFAGADLWTVGVVGFNPRSALAGRYFDACAGRGGGSGGGSGRGGPPAATSTPPATAPPAPSPTLPPAASPTASPSPTPPAALAPVADPGDPAVRYFPAVGHTLRGAFRAYWEAHGGLAQFGYPLTEEFSEVSATDGQPYTVQYFERARFEHHPEYAGTPAAVLLGLLGRELTAGRAGEPAFAPLPPDPALPALAPTGQRVAPAFAATWAAAGGVAGPGYPLSGAFDEVSPTDGHVYQVQYFERARYELHPDLPAPFTVSAGLLGVQALQARGWLR